jgi:parallel beta-helix repeat protein
VREKDIRLLSYKGSRIAKKHMGSGVLNTSRKLIAYSLVLSLLSLCLFIAVRPAHAVAGINQQINFQGRLLNAQGATVPDGYYNIQFKIYQDGDGQTAGNTTGSPAGTLKWTESHINDNGKGILVRNGFMSVQLGSVTAFGSSVDWDQDTLWLSMNVGNTNATCTPFTSCAPDGEMVPMKRMSSTPYAINSGQLGGKTSAQFLQLAQGVQTDASTNTSSIFVNKTSTGNLLQLQASGTDVFTLSNAGDITFGANANHTLGVSAAAASTAGRQLTVSAGGGGSGTGSVGGDLVLQGGAAGGTNANGGNVTINAGAKTGTGTDGIVSIGTNNTSGISLGQNTTLAAGKSLTITGSGTRPSSPLEGMVYFDTTTKQLLTYANGKWQADRTEAVIVAASTSSQADKDAADFVADGNGGSANDGDQVQINSALTAASGKKVVLLAGTYVADATILIPNNTVLSGVGRGTLIELADLDATDNLIENSDTSGGTGVRVQDLRIDGRNDLNTAGTQYGVYFNGLGAGTGASARQGGLVSGVIANNFRNYGLYLASSSHNNITNVRVQNNSGGGIGIDTSSHYNIIIGNLVTGNDSGIVVGGTNTTVTGNTTQGNNLAGIYLLGGSLNTVTGNTASGNTVTGIAIQTTNNNVVSGNQAYDNGGSTTNNGIFVTNSDSNTITGNNVNDGTGTTNCSTNCFAINISNVGSDTNYLASNTLGNGTINNLGTGTIYGGQVNNSGNYLVQPAGTIELMKNTTVQSGTLTVGTSTTQGSLVISDGSSNTATIQVGSLAGNYAYTIPVTTANDTFCMLTLANCASTGVTAVGTYSTTNTAADGATISGNSIIFQDASATAPGMVGTGTQTFAGDKTFTGSLTVNNVSFDPAANRSISMGTAATDTAGRSLTMAAGAAGTGASALAGGTLVIQGGAGGGTNGNGGDVTITGGIGNGTGVRGLVNLGPNAHTTVTNASCAVDCTILQSNVDNYGTIIVAATASGIVITLPAPTNTAPQGRTLFITSSAASQDFTLRTNTGADIIDIAMRKNTTASMIWNGVAWTPGGASIATTLQATYDNSTNPSTTPEIKLDTTRGTIDIQDADTSIGTDLLNIRGSNAAGLGTVLFGVGNTGRVTIQGAVAQSSAFRVLNPAGDYLFNINSSNNYIINNATRATGNDIDNPSFEAGGSITSGEGGWFGPAIASFANEPANAHTGNYVMKVTANTSNIDVFAGSYVEVVPGEMLYMEGWVKNSVGANGNAGIQFTWYDKDKAVISNSPGYPNNPGTSYVQRTLSATAPAGAQYARASATVRVNATTGTFYFDDFYLKRNLETADMTYKGAVNSATAFRIQSTGAANTLFTANTNSNIVRIGDGSGTGTDTTVLVVDSATADPTSLTGLDGGIFYRSDSGGLKAILGGTVVDICTTAVTCSGYSASAGSSIQLQATSPGTVQTGNFNITGTGILTKLQTQDNASGSTQGLTIKTGNSTGGASGSLTIDVGTATGTKGTITIGSAGVQATMPGTLSIQGSNTLALGNSSTASASILFKTAAGANTVTLAAPAANPSASYTLTLPTNLGSAGECIKIDATGGMYFQGCGVGVNFNLQDAYNNSGTPAEITLSDAKNLRINASEVAGTDPSIVFDLLCGSSCDATTNGRFKVQNAGSDILSVLPNGGGIVLNAKTQIGSSTTDSTQINFQLDSYNGTSDTGACSTSVNQGAMYYNTNMGSIRSCINGSWSDVSNPDTLGLLTFGIVPSSGAQPYDLPSLIQAGYTGPCKVSWESSTSVHIEACTAYSNGRRLSVPARTLNTNSATTPNTSLTTTDRWGHVCLNPTSGEPEFTSTSGLSSATAGMPTFSASTPILCLADVQGSGSTAGVIDNLYDVRTFTSAMKEAVNVAAAIELGMMADSSSAGIVPSAACSSGTCSGKLYGLVVATDGATSSGAPNAIVTSVGPGYVKSISGNAGEFAKASTTAGYAATVTAIPNNAFYFSPGNTRTAYSTTCSAANNCGGSMYVNFIVR